MAKNLRAVLKLKTVRVICALLIVVILATGVFVFVANANSKANPDILQVVRPKNPLRPKIAMFEKRITAVTEVQKLYNAALALPGVSPFATYNCPLDNGTKYELTFLDGTTKIKTMELEITGCAFISIDTDNIFHPQDVHHTDQAFFELFSHTIGFTNVDDLYKDM
ncbi:hypothetical protein KDA_63490 [Dictyobacter alpinus]|uniref:Uncharacterized protein n=1 Tax=Dictyobacter alpinus TaxID=2014873 RepID=A0A402BHM4_9CHLR|nr:hypothetical protein [Dictyobacter alpinus]GCE30865.1 hypothetical protein KDA_63490 [Dictyobacter alpinus]